MPHRITAREPYAATLQPCPFCGTRDLSIETDDGYHVLCEACVTTGPSGCTEESAVDLWNARFPGEK